MIESLGKMFDPDIHEPAGFQKNNAYPEKTVMEVKRNGFMLDNKLLRSSLLVLSKKVSPQSIQKDGNNWEHKKNNQEL